MHDAMDAFARGNAHAAKGELGQASTEYSAALECEPSHVGALNNLATVLRAQGQPMAAIACLRRARALEPRAGIAVNLGLAWSELHRPEEAVSALREALDLDPALAEAWSILGGAELARDQPRAALDAFGRALALAPDFFPARFGQALTLLGVGAWRAGWAAYECRFEDAEQARARPVPAWRGEPVAGRTVLLRAEQGFGDTIQFARYGTAVAALGARIVLQVPPPLVRLLACLADEVGTFERGVPSFDVGCTLMSLPHLLGTAASLEPGGVPPARLAPDAAHLAAWAARLPPAPGGRIGIAFSGRESHVDDGLRSLDAGALVAALAGGNATLHVVQTELRPADRAAVGALPFVHDFSAELGDFADTAALLAHMDLVVSVDTAVAHLAATLGRPTWILLQHAADFRWGRERADTPWYPSARLFRQPAPGGWASVLGAVTEALDGWSAASPR